MFCLDKAINFISDEANLKLAREWITSGKIVLDEEELKAKLTEDQKYGILKSFYASTHFNLTEKETLREKTFENDKSDKAQSVQLICDYSLPDAALKEKLWSEISDVGSKDSLL